MFLLYVGFLKVGDFYEIEERVLLDINFDYIQQTIVWEPKKGKRQVESFEADLSNKSSIGRFEQGSNFDTH